MNRRAFVAGSLACLAAPLGAAAQQAGKVYRVGVLSSASPMADMVGPDPTSRSIRALLQRLRELGYVSWVSPCSMQK